MNRADVVRRAHERVAMAIDHGQVELQQVFPDMASSAAATQAMKMLFHSITTAMRAVGATETEVREELEFTLRLVKAELDKTIRGGEE